MLNLLSLYHTVKLPSWAIVSIVNDDNSALSDQQITQVNLFCKEYPQDAFSFDFSNEERNFEFYPEFGKSCDCIELDIYIYANKAQVV